MSFVLRPVRAGQREQLCPKGSLISSAVWMCENDYLFRGYGERTMECEVGACVRMTIKYCECCGHIIEVRCPVCGGDCAFWQDDGFASCEYCDWSGEPGEVVE